MNLNILIACEFSGRVRDAFIARGHDAISCDLLPTEKTGPHIQGDVIPLLQEPWDLVIAFPPCTYLCNSGVRWLHTQPGRWELMRDGAEFFKQCLNANAPRVSVENPVMHKYASSIIGHSLSFTIQPWQFGHGETKRTCFWTKGLPILTPTDIVAGRKPVAYHRPPQPERWKLRSRTYLGIAKAIADQWG